MAYLLGLFYGIGLFFFFLVYFKGLRSKCSKKDKGKKHALNKG
jgi:hypothetical protein